MTPDQAMAEAKSGTLRPVYLVLGEESRLGSDVVRALREAITRSGIPGLNDDQLVAGESTVQAALSAAKTLPMMAKRRIVIVKNVERWQTESKQDNALDLLADYTEKPSESTVLILVASKLDKRKRLVARAQKQGFLVSCDALDRAQLRQWIERTTAELGNTISRPAAELLGELAGPDLSGVADSLERVCLFVGNQQPVTEAAITECVVRLRETNVWALVDAVGRRDVGGALKALTEVYDPSDRGLRLVSVLAWSARQLIRFEAAIADGLPPPDAAKKAGAPPFKARDLAEQIKRLSRTDLERWLVALADIDLNLKGGSKRPPKAVLEHALIRLCQAGGRPGQRSARA